MLCIDLDNKQFVKQERIKYSYGVNMHTTTATMMMLMLMVLPLLFVPLPSSLPFKLSIIEKYNLHMNFSSAIVFFYNTVRIHDFGAGTFIGFANVIC